MKFLRDITRGTYDSPRTPVLVLIYLHSETWLVNPAGPTGYTMWLGEGFSPTLSPSTVPHRISRTVQGASQLAAFVCARLCIWIVGVGSGMPRVTKSGWGNAPRECPLSGGLRYIDWMLPRSVTRHSPSGSVHPEVGGWTHFAVNKADICLSLRPKAWMSTTRDTGRTAVTVRYQVGSHRHTIIQITVELDCLAAHQSPQQRA